MDWPTLISSESVGESAEGSVMLSHTNMVASYLPSSLGIQDNAVESDCAGSSVPLSQASETVTPWSFWIWTMYAKSCGMSWPFFRSAAIWICFPTATVFGS